MAILTQNRFFFQDWISFFFLDGSLLHAATRLQSSNITDEKSRWNWDTRDFHFSQSTAGEKKWENEKKRKIHTGVWDDRAKNIRAAVRRWHWTHKDEILWETIFEDDDFEGILIASW